MALILAVVAYFIIVKNYKKTTYYEITKTPYLVLLNDKGKLGEYMIYKNLKSYESLGAKFLFNGLKHCHKAAVGEAEKNRSIIQ